MAARSQATSVPSYIPIPKGTMAIENWTFPISLHDYGRIQIKKALPINEQRFFFYELSLPVTGLKIKKYRLALALQADIQPVAHLTLDFLSLGNQRLPARW